MRNSFSFFLAGFVFLFAATRTQADKLVLVAGGGTNEVGGVPASQARLKEPFGMGFDAAGNLFIIEMAKGNRLLKMDAQGVLTHIAGEGLAGDAGDGGPALKARFNSPHGLAVLPGGEVLVADTWNGRIRRVDFQPDKVASISGFA